LQIANLKFAILNFQSSGVAMPDSAYWDQRAELPAPADAVGWEGHDLAQHEAWTLRLLDGLVKPGTRVLDVACGYGRLAQAVADRGGEWTGVDFSVRMRDRWLAGCRIGTFHLADARLKWPDVWFGRYDLVLCVGALKQLYPAFVQFAIAYVGTCRPGATIVSIERTCAQMHRVG
jgi:SAM-dependent methyltransferase